MLPLSKNLTQSPAGLLSTAAERPAVFLSRVSVVVEQHSSVRKRVIEWFLSDGVLYNHPEAPAVRFGHPFVLPEPLVYINPAFSCTVTFLQHSRAATQTIGRLFQKQVTAPAFDGGPHRPVSRRAKGR